MRRFSIAALFFLISSFIFFISWAVSSLLLNEVYNALSPYSASLGSEYSGLITLIPYAFGIIAAIFFVCALLFIFVLDSLADEPEMYWR
jgi:hypothetical protein